MAYIELNEHISVDLGDGQFVERTDVLTEYSDKLKIYQSTTHEDNGQNFAWIKVAPQCSYDIYLIANSEEHCDYIGIFEGYLEFWGHGSGGELVKHNGGNDPYTDLSNWTKTQISNNTDEDIYYTIIWGKDGSASNNEDIGWGAINITTETIVPPIVLPSNVLFQNNKRMFYLGNEIVRYIKYNDVNVNEIGTVWQNEYDNGRWMTYEGWVGTHDSLAEQWNVMRPVWFRSNTFSDSTSLSISFNIFYRQGYAQDIPTDRQVNVMLYVYDADGNRISKQENPIPCINEIGITEEENTELGLFSINSVGLYVPNNMSETETTFNSFPDLYKITFDDVTIPSGGMYEIFFTSVNNPFASWMIWDRNVQENIL